MSTVWDLERVEDALGPLAREIRGAELNPADAAWIADYITSMLVTGETPECTVCASHEDYGCEDTNAVTRVRNILADWPADIAPQFRDQIARALP